MKNYEKPVLVAIEELAEGIYAASGLMTFTCRDCDWFVFNQQVTVRPIDNVKNIRDQNSQEGKIINYDHCKAGHPNASLKIISLEDPSRDGMIAVTGLGTEPLEILARGNDQLLQFTCH